MSEDLSVITGMFKANASIMEKALQTIPSEQWLSKPADGSNHLMWIAGHVVVHRAMVLKLLGSSWSAPWEKLFVRGAPQAAPGQYPDAAEIKKEWEEVSGKLYTLLSSVPAEALAQPAPQKPPSFNGKIAGSIAFLGFHESYHMGQIAYLKKWLGHGQTVG